MRNLVNITLVLSLVAAFSFSYGQCAKPEKIIKPHYKQGWGLDAQSRAGALEMGKPYELSFVASGGVDYKVSTATTNVEEETQIDFVIYEMAVEKIEEDGKKRYVKFKKVLFDSKESDNAKTMEFSSTKGRKLFINVTVPATPDEKGKMQCIAVLIEHQKSMKEGF